MADNLTPSQRRHAMSRVKNKDTGIEVLFRSRLHRQGLRFRKNVKSLPGSPDIVFSRSKIAVFVDGDFWHGYDFSEWCNGLTQFWKDKIQTNIRRDRTVTAKLTEMGWYVIRVWEHEIHDDVDSCVLRIENAVRNSDS